MDRKSRHLMDMVNDRIESSRSNVSAGTETPSLCDNDDDTIRNSFSHSRTSIETTDTLICGKEADFKSKVSGAVETHKSRIYRPDVWSPTRGPIVQFARFINGKVVLFTESTTELEYIAISHVWGSAEWLKIPGLENDVKASRQKAFFIERELPGLVGEYAFWMDVLTVNQGHQAEVMSAVHLSPRIFRDAVKTIAIRENDGIYKCCQKAVANFSDQMDFVQKLSSHTDDKHRQHCLDESYLQRLWPLEECLFSHTIQFILINQDDYKSRDPILSHDRHDPNCHHTEVIRLCDSLWALAHLFSYETKGQAGLSEFVKEYVECGTIQRTKGPWPPMQEQMCNGDFKATHKVSQRSATRPRDYVLATTPQLTWYQCPERAETQSFGELFPDFCRQAAQSRFSFAPRITRTMTEKRLTDPQTAWQCSTILPEPTCLGDFLKLIGNQHVMQNFQGLEYDGTAQIHWTNNVTAVTIHDDHHDVVLSMLERAMQFSDRFSKESHVGGDLSKYGRSPDKNWTLNEIDAWYSGWTPKLAPIHYEYPRYRRTSSYFVPPLEYEETPGAIERFEESGMAVSSMVDPMLEHAMRILDFMACGININGIDTHSRTEWAHFCLDMKKSWTRPLLHTMALLMAMIGCQIGLSAANWVRKHFVPVSINYPTSRAIGLLAKHAMNKSNGGVPLWSVGRHFRGTHLGRDLVLVDPTTHAPVGLIPDFIYNGHTAETWQERVRLLYDERLIASIDGQERSCTLSLIALADVKEFEAKHKKDTV